MRKFVLVGLCASFLLGSTAFAAGKATSGKKVKPQVYSQKFGSWYYRCVVMKFSKQKQTKQCEVTQVSQVKQNKKMVNVLTLAMAQVTVTDKKKKKSQKWVMTALTPLNIYLPSGFSIAFAEKEKADSLRYRNCNQAGCWVQHILEGNILKGLLKNSNAFAKMRLMNGQNVNIKFSLAGLGKAMKALRGGKLPKKSNS